MALRGRRLEVTGVGDGLGGPSYGVFGSSIGTNRGSVRIWVFKEYFRG